MGTVRCTECREAVLFRIFDENPNYFVFCIVVRTVKVYGILERARSRKLIVNYKQ